MFKLDLNIVGGPSIELCCRCEISISLVWFLDPLRFEPKLLHYSLHGWIFFSENIRPCGKRNLFTIISSAQFDCLSNPLDKFVFWPAKATHLLPIYLIHVAIFWTGLTLFYTYIHVFFSKWTLIFQYFLSFETVGIFTKKAIYRI